MISIFQGFTYPDWWKSLAVILTAIFTFVALATETKRKVVNASSQEEKSVLTGWDWLSVAGIILAAAGGFLAQIADSSHQVQESATRAKMESTRQIQINGAIRADGIAAARNVLPFAIFSKALAAALQLNDTQNELRAKLASHRQRP